MTAVTPEDVEREARKWIGTPWHHQERVCQIGCDCGGVVIGTARACGLASEYVDRKDYAAEPDGFMELLLKRHMVQIPWVHRRQGDVVHVAFGHIPQHVGILTASGTLIHAYGPNGVVETNIGGHLHRGVRGVYRFREFHQ